MWDFSKILVLKLSQINKILKNTMSTLSFKSDYLDLFNISSLFWKSELLVAFISFLFVPISFSIIHPFKNRLYNLSVPKLYSQLPNTISYASPLFFTEIRRSRTGNFHYIWIKWRGKNRRRRSTIKYIQKRRIMLVCTFLVGQWVSR